MKLSLFATVGLVLVGVAGALAWTHFDQAAKLKAGKWVRVQATVLQVVEARSAQHGAIAVLRWATDDGRTNDGGAYVTGADFKAGRFKAGETVWAWVHPGFARPELGEAEPNLAPDQGFTGKAAVACLILGLALLAFTLATARFSSTGAAP
ncbi:MAG: DUF3592 domain-containing protein [Deltaproteobacteria bacterium]|nr:DUF3592 domain-containing protein [Deltaproteobacteria bacterium]